jgi:hypothetical protein
MKETRGIFLYCILKVIRTIFFPHHTLFWLSQYAVAKMIASYFNFPMGFVMAVFGTLSSTKFSFIEVEDDDKFFFLHRIFIHT